MKAIEVDVLVCGAGPTGLVLATLLARMGVRTLVIEKYSLDVKQTHGRATTLYPRTLEMLDQLELLDEMNQIGVIGRNSVTYKNGKRVQSRGWHNLFTQFNESYLNYILNIRQRYSEDVFRRQYESYGEQVRYGTKLNSFTVHNDASLRVEAVVEDISTGDLTTVRGKFLIGADGGSSTVRKHANIPFQRDESVLRWVRIDGLMDTDMPDAKFGLSAIETPSHGNVLWVNLDHGRTRVGYAFSKQMLEKYGDQMTEQQAVEEAARALAPFSLTIKHVDWWTVYSIKQGVADSFSSNGCVFLAGDACHVHSSATAQGMNTAVHDAVNLGWKLGGVIRGFYDKKILATYENERRPAALELVRLDKAFSTLVSGNIPEEYRHIAATADPNQLLGQVFDQSLPFTTGLGVHYESNVLNCSPNTSNLQAGWRAPDALLYPPGSQIPVRLFQLTRNMGIFHILLFAGNPQNTKQQYGTAREYIENDFSQPRIVKFITIIGGMSNSAEDELGGSPVGYAYYDRDHTAHVKYGTALASGAAVVVRPDGIFAFATDLDKMEEIDHYFQQFTTCT